MYINILFLPILTFLLIGLCGNLFGKFACKFITLICGGSAFIISIYIFYEVVLCKAVVVIELYNWVVFYDGNINLGLLYDSLTCVMLVIITFISFMVQLYSLGYMKYDPFLCRFLSYLSLFTFFMELLVTSDNFVQMFIGWEGVGICSYLLINFWFSRILANKAALKAMIVNRLADVFFVIAILLIFLNFKTVNYFFVFQLVQFFLLNNIIFFSFSFNLIDIICFFLFIGAIGKSAQLGFHVWLADAMEGPTPVSALLHAATMVTAGVFLILRCSYIFEYSSLILHVVSIIGAFTAFFFAFVAVFQYDIKKIVAYSTCSQLGYMFFSCGLSNYSLAFFHLFNHSFFKSLLFLGMGCISHSLFDEQDIRRMGSLFLYLPATYISILIGSISIMGLPFLTGFYSKDLILEFAFCQYIIDGSFIYLFGLWAAFLTALYSARLLFFVFFISSNTISIVRLEEDFGSMLAVVFILSFFSLFVGYVFNDLFAGCGNPFFSDSFLFLFLNFYDIDVEFLYFFVKNLPFIFSLIGFISGFVCFYCLMFYSKFLKVNNFYYFLFLFLSEVSRFLYSSGFFNFLYNNYFVFFFIMSYKVNTKLVDKGFLELIGPLGIYRLFKFLSKLSLEFSPFIIFFSLFYIFVFTCIILLFFLHMQIVEFFIFNRGLFFICGIIFFIELTVKIIKYDYDS